MSYPTLDEIVIDTLHFYQSQKNLPEIHPRRFSTPLVVGSGNGYYTGRILFRNVGAYFAGETEVEKKLSNIQSITEVIVISASGEKHAPIVLEIAKKYKKRTVLISSNQKSTAQSLADESIIMPKIREPYTYNTSTYFGYMLAEDTHLDLIQLEDFIKNTLESSYRQNGENGLDIDFAHYSGFFIVLPDDFVLLREMIEVKFIELFGRKVARDVFTYEQMKHATTVVQDDKELFLCFGNEKGIVYGQHQINLPIFDSSSYAAMMLVAYYLVGKIQRSLPPYFIESIEEYCKRSKVQSGFHISPWVEA